MWSVYGWSVTYMQCAARCVAKVGMNYRIQFNQNGPNVEVQVFVKHLNKKRERVTVDIQEKALRVEIKNDDVSEVEYLLEEELYQPINVTESKWDVWATQVNIKLRKGDPSIVWPSLAHTDTPV